MKDILGRFHSPYDVVDDDVDDLNTEIHDPEKMCQEQMDYESLPTWLQNKLDDPGRNIEEVDMLVGYHLDRLSQRYTLLTREAQIDWLKEAQSWQRRGIDRLNADRQAEADECAEEVRGFIAIREREGLDPGQILGEAMEMFGISRSTFFNYKKGMKT